MITKISTADTTTFEARFKKPSNKTLARVHYINFLKAEDKFFKESDIFAQQQKDLSLKTIVTFGKAVKHVLKMGYERALSAYYFKK